MKEEEKKSTTKREVHLGCYCFTVSHFYLNCQWRWQLASNEMPSFSIFSR